MADLEDRPHRNNLKISGIPETVQTHQLPHFVQDLIKAVVPSLTSEDLTIHRIHCIPKPSFLPPEVPRDVLMRIHFFQAKKMGVLSTVPYTPQKFAVHTALLVQHGLFLFT